MEPGERPVNTASFAMGVVIIAGLAVIAVITAVHLTREGQTQDAEALKGQVFNAQQGVQGLQQQIDLMGLKFDQMQACSTNPVAPVCDGFNFDLPTQKLYCMVNGQPPKLLAQVKKAAPVIGGQGEGQ